MSALFVINPKLGASVPAEIELRQITVQILEIDVLIDADEAHFRTEKKPSSVLVWASHTVQLC